MRYPTSTFCLPERKEKVYFHPRTIFPGPLSHLWSGDSSLFSKRMPLWNHTLRNQLTFENTSSQVWHLFHLKHLFKRRLKSSENAAGSIHGMSYQKAISTAHSWSSFYTGIGSEWKLKRLSFRTRVLILLNLKLFASWTLITTAKGILIIWNWGHEAKKSNLIQFSSRCPPISSSSSWAATKIDSCSSFFFRLIRYTSRLGMGCYKSEYWKHSTPYFSF